MNLLDDSSHLPLGDIDVDKFVDDSILDKEAQDIRSCDEAALKLLIPPTSVSKELKRLLPDMAIAADVPPLIAKALELMVSEVSLRSLLSLRMEDPRRKRVQPGDITAGLSSTSRFDFLRDVTPPDELATILAMHRT